MPLIKFRLSHQPCPAMHKPCAVWNSSAPHPDVAHTVFIFRHALCLALCVRHRFSSMFSCSNREHVFELEKGEVERLGPVSHIKVCILRSKSLEIPAAFKLCRVHVAPLTSRAPLKSRYVLRRAAQRCGSPTSPWQRLLDPQPKPLALKISFFLG